MNFDRNYTPYRRVALLRAIGSSKAPESSLLCCDVCGVGTQVADEPFFEALVSSLKMRGKAVRIKCLGLYLSAVIDDICSDARFIDLVDFLSSTSLFMPNYFSAPSDILKDPPPSRGMRKIN